MPKFRYKILQAEKVYQALVIAGEAAREAPFDFDIGPWDDTELRQHLVIEVVGSDEAANLVVNRWIDQAVGFEEI